MIFIGNIIKNVAWVGSTGGVSIYIYINHVSLHMMALPYNIQSPLPGLVLSTYVLSCQLQRLRGLFPADLSAV